MPSRKVSMRSSITNKTSIFGIMGGLYNRTISGRSSMNRVTSRLEIPAGAKEGYQYMKMHNLLSRNPLGSGGIGKMFRLRSGGSSLGSNLGQDLANTQKPPNNLEDIYGGTASYASYLKVGSPCTIVYGPSGELARTGTCKGVAMMVASADAPEQSRRACGHDVGYGADGACGGPPDTTSMSNGMRCCDDL